MIQGQYLSAFYEEYSNAAQYVNTIDNKTVWRFSRPSYYPRV